MFFQDVYCASRLVTSPFVISILTHFMNLGKDTTCAAKMGFTGYTTKLRIAVFLILSLPAFTQFTFHILCFMYALIPQPY
jgi:phage-related holin